MSEYISNSIAKIITVLQISQMFIGLVITLIVLKELLAGVPCEVTYGILYFRLVMYGSYFILFINFFYHRYCNKTKLKRQ